jgi:hypothetical protein
MQGCLIVCGHAIVQASNQLAHLIKQAGRLQRRRTGFHGKFIPVYLSSIRTAKPTGKRVSLFFQKRCIGTRRMYRPGFAVYITLKLMMNIQVIDGADNSVYDIFSATEEEFLLIFPLGQDVAFIEEVMARGPESQLDAAFSRIWTRRLPKREAMGIHGTLFCELDHKQQYYPTRRDEEAINPDGTRLR